MPVPLQNLMITAFGFQWRRRRFGGFYGSFLKEVYEKEFNSSEQWTDHQTKMLRRILVHAFNHVQFYNKKYKDAGFSEADLNNLTLSDMIHIPFLEKEELRVYGTTNLLSDKLSSGVFISSSGSTGTPTKIYLPGYFHQKWTALMEGRVRNWAGVSKDTPRGMIGGRRILPGSEATPPFYRYNHFEKQTYFSAYHISPETIDNYLKGIIDNKVEYITGYAMSIFLLAKFIFEKGLKSPKLKAVITSSEKLTHGMRRTIEDVFKCKSYDSYSGCEACGLISETPEGILVVSPDAGIMEFINNNGNYATPGESGEIVSTGLLNYDQPLIRYRIGDVARLSTEQLQVGGRNMIRIDEIEGRIEDIVVTRDGKSMVRFHGLYLNIAGLKQSQLIQHDYQHFTINLLVDIKSYNKLEAEEILKKRLESQV
ncbi:MAG: phenylacetate--CoA ligase family protein, partial [Bacteroidales bacterium]|nr:phenylacetate--CoA ligase family protein [Bacteroidales bacterium]